MCYIIINNRRYFFNNFSDDFFTKFLTKKEIKVYLFDTQFPVKKNKNEINYVCVVIGENLILLA